MENKSNIAPFYSGQKVVYVGPAQHMKNKTFIVEYCRRNSCGCWVVFIVGANKRIEKIVPDLPWVCVYCHSEIIDDGARACGPPEDFRPLEQKPFPLIKLSQIKEQELCAN